MSRVILSIISLLLCTIAVAGGGNVAGGFSISYISIPERNKIFCSESMLRDSVWCSNFNSENPTHMIYIGGVDPEQPDSVKAERIVELDGEIYSLQKYKDCAELRTLILCVSESLFLQMADALEYGTERYYKKGRELNAQRFIERYENILRQWFPSMTIYVSCWEW
jgi:hypothetical protein